MGQFCTISGFTSAVGDEATAVFFAELEARIWATATGTMLFPAIRETYVRQLGRVGTVAGVRATARSESTGQARQARATLFVTTAEVFRTQPTLAEEVFGLTGLVLLCRSVDESAKLSARLERQLTASVWGREAELRSQASLVALLERNAGRLLNTAWPTGVEVGPAMVHGWPFPATNVSRFSSVGTSKTLSPNSPVTCCDGKDASIAGPLVVVYGRSAIDLPVFDSFLFGFSFQKLGDVGVDRPD